MTTILDEPDDIWFFQYMARRSAVALELVGLRRRGRSAAVICREVYWLKGTPKQVHEQMDFMVKEVLRRREEERGYLQVVQFPV